MAVKYSGTFAITGAPTITLTYPNSGTFYVGDTVNITWTTTGTVGNVRIKIYNTANSNLGYITSSTANDGSYSWVIPGSLITAHETEYQLRIEQVSGSSPYDYSGNLEIYPYANKSASDDISIGQSTSRSDSVWKLARSVTDDISIGQGTVLKETDTWKHVRTVSDDISIGQATGKTPRDWKNVQSVSDDISIGQEVRVRGVAERSVSDDISIGQGTVSKIVDTWKHIRSVSDNLSLDQGSVVRDDRDWKNVKVTDDDISIAQAVSKASDVWKHMQTALDNLSFDQGTVSKVPRIWKYIRPALEDISISQTVVPIITGHREALDELSIDQGTVSKVVDAWKHTFSLGDDLSIGQEVSSVPDKWKHLQSLSDDIDVDDTAVKTPGTWREIEVQTRQDDISITSTFQYATGDWAQASTLIEDISIGQTVDKDVTVDDGKIRFISGSTVVILGENILPESEPIYPKQLVKVAGGGQAKVTDYSNPEEYISIKAIMDATTKSNVLGFLNSQANYTKNTFIYQDESQNRSEVRLWDATGLDIPTRQGNMNQMSIMLRKE